MIRIAIVDDEESFRDRIEEIASGALSGEEAETEIKKYPDGVCFYEAVSAGETFDILLADIQMAGMDGMELGRKIRRENPGLYIIFVTSYEEYAARRATASMHISISSSRI